MEHKCIIIFFLEFNNFTNPNVVRIKSKLQVLSFMFVSNFRCCPLPLKLTSVLNVPKSCKLYPLDQTQLIFFVKSGHPKGIFFPCLFSIFKK
ncbi:hypothetical protein Hanom_Chr02g00171381 [Helianthus anomalus]